MVPVLHLTPATSSYPRTFYRVGARVFVWTRRYPLALPLRLWWSLLERLVFAWWWWGQGEDGAARWRWYRRLEDFVGGVFVAFYVALYVWIEREIGD